MIVVYCLRKQRYWTAKVVDGKRPLVVGDCRDSKKMGWERPLAVKNLEQQPAPLSAKQPASAQVLTILLWKQSQRQAGSPPNIPS